MNDTAHAADTRPALQVAPARQLVLGALFGIVFGFLLQKGGVAKFHVLIGMLILEDFTVIKVMLSAVVVGMIGIWSLRALGLVELHVKPTRYAGNVLGGLVFGAGFALAAYCPGTGAAALGQGNFDALAMMAGMVAGSLVFAAVSARANRLASRWGEQGRMLWPDVLRLSAPRAVAAFTLALTAVLLGVAVLPG
jgi:uncharacterized membrane protein YedE/YeeE